MTNSNSNFILASTSPIRAQLLQAAGLTPRIIAPRVDEETIMDSLLADHVSPRDIADALADAKARKVSGQYPEALVLGCDQTLGLVDTLFSKPKSQQQALEQLHSLQGQTHHLYAAAVLYQNGRPLWRHVGHARLTMRLLSSAFLSDYVTQNWQSIQHAVGCYKIEEIGIQLFSEIEGDTFTIQGLPLLPLLNYLALRGVIAS